MQAASLALALKKKIKINSFFLHNSCRAGGYNNEQRYCCVTKTFSIMVAKDFLTYVLRDDATPYGGVSFHGETLGDFIGETDYLSEDSDMDTVNSALIECGIMPVPFYGMLHAFRVEGRHGLSEEPVVLYYMFIDPATLMARTLVRFGSEATVTDMLDDSVVFEGDKDTLKREYIAAAQSLVHIHDGFVRVDGDDLKICDGVGDDGEDEGEWHCVVGIDHNGVDMDNGDFYPYNDLTVRTICFYIL